MRINPANDNTDVLVFSSEVEVVDGLKASILEIINNQRSFLELQTQDIGLILRFPELRDLLLDIIIAEINRDPSKMKDIPKYLELEIRYSEKHLDAFLNILKRELDNDIISYEDFPGIVKDAVCSLERYRLFFLDIVITGFCKKPGTLIDVSQEVFSRIESSVEHLGLFLDLVISKIEDKSIRYDRIPEVIYIPLQNSIKHNELFLDFILKEISEDRSMWAVITEGIMMSIGKSESHLEDFLKIVEKKIQDWQELYSKEGAPYVKWGSEKYLKKIIGICREWLELEGLYLRNIPNDLQAMMKETEEGRQLYLDMKSLSVSILSEDHAFLMEEDVFLSSIAPQIKRSAEAEVVDIAAPQIEIPAEVEEVNLGLISNRVLHFKRLFDFIKGMPEGCVPEGFLGFLSHRIILHTHFMGAPKDYKGWLKIDRMMLHMIHILSGLGEEGRVKKLNFLITQFKESEGGCFTIYEDEIYNLYSIILERPIFRNEKFRVEHQFELYLVDMLNIIRRRHYFNLKDDLNNHLEKRMSVHGSDVHISRVLNWALFDKGFCLDKRRPRNSIIEQDLFLSSIFEALGFLESYDKYRLGSIDIEDLRDMVQRYLISKIKEDYRALEVVNSFKYMIDCQLELAVSNDRKAVKLLNSMGSYFSNIDKDFDTGILDPETFELKERFSLERAIACLKIAGFIKFTEMSNS